MRKKRSVADKEISNCNLSIEGEEMVTQSLQAVHTIMGMWVEFENKKVNQSLKVYKIHYWIIV